MSLWAYRQAGLTLEDLRVLTDEQADLFCEVDELVQDHALHADEDAQAAEDEKKFNGAFFGA